MLVSSLIPQLQSALAADDLGLLGDLLKNPSLSHSEQSLVARISAQSWSAPAIRLCTGAFPHVHPAMLLQAALEGSARLKALDSPAEIARLKMALEAACSHRPELLCEICPSNFYDQLGPAPREVWQAVLNIPALLPSNSQAYQGAVLQNNIEAIEELGRCGVSPDPSEPGAPFPLGIALTMGTVEAFAALLQAGAQVTLPGLPSGWVQDQIQAKEDPRWARAYNEEMAQRQQRALAAITPAGSSRAPRL